MAQPTNTTQGRSNRGFVPSAEDAALAAPPIDGGKIQGPGTGTSDSIPDQMPEGTFIMPTDSTKAMGIKTLNQLANMPAVQGSFTPEQAHAAGVAFLTSLRDATHAPVQKEEAGEQEATEMPVEDDPAQRNFANGGLVQNNAERQTLNSNGTVQGANGQLAAGHSVPAGGGGGSPSIPDSGRPFGFTNPNYWNQMGREDMRKAEAGPGSNLASGTSKLSLSSGGRRFADGGAVQASGFMSSAQRLEGGGVVKDKLVNQSNFFPYNSPDAGVNIYGGVGLPLGSSSQFAQVPDSIGGQPGRQPARPNSFGDAAAAANNPGVTQVAQAVPKTQQQAPARAPKQDAAPAAPKQASASPSNIFPQGHPSAGANIYAGFGFGEASPKQDAAPKQDSQPKQAAPKSAPKQQAAPDPATSGLNAPWWSPEYVRSANASDKSGAELEAMRVAKATPKEAPADDVLKRVFHTGSFASNDTAPVQPAPKPKADANPQSQSQSSPAASPATPASNPAAVLQKAQAKATQVLQQRLASDGRAGMTNADVAQANPNGVVNVKRGANGVMEFSGNNVTGDVSYAGSDGQPMQGGGLRNKGFSTVDVAPAGANVAMGPNGSYAFSNTPTRQAAAPTQAPSMAQGLVPGYGQQQGAAPDPLSGMTGEQRMQYAREVEAAQTNARGNQIAEGMRGPKHLRDWNDLRSPVGIAKRNLEFDMKNNPINRSLSGKGGGGGGGGNTLAQKAAAQAYEQLSANQFKGDGVTDFDRQKYADGQARQQQMDAWGMGKDAARQGMEAQQYQDGAPQRALDQQTAQIMNEAINPNTPPERRAALLKTLNEANGKVGGVQIKAIDLPDQLNPDGMNKMKGGQVLVAIHPDGRVQQVNPQQGQGDAGAPRQVSKAEFDALPKGAKFIDPNGQVRIK